MSLETSEPFLRACQAAPVVKVKALLSPVAGVRYPVFSVASGAHDLLSGLSEHG